jgi:hypothetical protein
LYSAGYSESLVMLFNLYQHQFSISKIGINFTAELLGEYEMDSVGHIANTTNVSLILFVL